MSNRSIQKLLILGALAILGVVFIQGFWVFKTWNLKDAEFDSSVRIALRKTAESLSKYNNSELPKQNIIQRRSSNTYVVNINDIIDAGLLEDFLIQNFEIRSLDADFEYGIYDCFSDDMLYGNYCDIGSRNKSDRGTVELPRFKELEYYFVVRFPSRVSYLLSNLKQAMLFSVIALLAIAFFIYAIFVILRQRRLSEMQRDFINNMTHEFKTPIASIKLAANTIAKDKRIIADKRMSKYVEIIDEQSNRMNLQVEKLLNVAALEKRNLDLQLETINMNILLEEMANDMNFRFEQNKGELQLIENEQNVMVTADQIHMTNVIYSLVDNAIKYSPDHLEVKIILNKNSMEIIDKGIGIDKEHIKQIFKKFFRVPTGNLHDVKGFGLGLYYVKTIINKLGWSIDVESKLGEGTNIKINFA